MVTPKEVQQLLAQIEQAGFFETPQTGKLVVPCCDRFSYTLTVSLEGKSHTIQTYDGAENQPQAIQSAFVAVANFIQAKAAPEGSEPIQ